MKNYLSSLQLVNENKLSFNFFLCAPGKFYSLSERKCFSIQERIVTIICSNKTVQLHFLVKVSTIMKTLLWDISYYIFFYIMLIFFLSRLFSRFSNKSWEKSHCSVSLRRSELQTGVMIAHTHKSKIIMS